MQFRSLHQIIVGVIDARTWLQSIPIPTTGTRLEKILDVLLTLQDPEASPLGKNAIEEEDIYYALSDGAGFALIAAEMSKLSSDLLPRRTLRDILKGPLAASEESSTSSDPRNKFVELELAAHFSSAGFKLLGFDDLKFEFEGCRYLVECKRPWHKGTLDNNIENAYEQLRSKLDGSACRGIVAVAVEKVFGLDNRSQPVDSEASAFAFAHSIGEEFRNELTNYYGRWLDTRVDGVLAIIRFLWRNKAPDTNVASYILGLVKFATPQVAQAAESKRLDRLIEALRHA